MKIINYRYNIKRWNQLHNFMDRKSLVMNFGLPCYEEFYCIQTWVSRSIFLVQRSNILVKVLFYFLQNMKHGLLIISLAPFQIRFLFGMIFCTERNAKFLTCRAHLCSWIILSYLSLKLIWNDETNWAAGLQYILIIIQSKHIFFYANTSVYVGYIFFLN
jgi:hypothetical protein